MNMIPKGFLFSTAEAAIRYPNRKDLALIYSEREANIAGAFTTNRVQAAPVRLDMKRIKSGKGQAIVVNSGNANACTGKKGMQDAAAAIMTTDTFPKIVHKKVKIGNKTGTIAGICKGAGMIWPNMATMLCFLMTDVAVEQKTVDKALKDAVRQSFNRISIDGDRSTNDTVLFMANGVLDTVPVTEKSESYNTFKMALQEVTFNLSKLIVKDGEGATKFIEIEVRNAKNEKDAERAAFAVANSNLVKTAIYGNDPNWGRIMAALGYSGVGFNETKTDIFFNNVKVVKNGISNNKDMEATKTLKKNKIKIIIDLHS